MVDDQECFGCELDKAAHNRLGINLDYLIDEEIRVGDEVLGFRILNVQLRETIGRQPVRLVDAKHCR